MKEFKLDKIKATGTTVGDVHFPKVSLHLTCEGSNGSTTVTDSSNTNASITCIGSAQISTAQSKFGNSSLGTASGDISISTTNIFNFGTSDFTVEFWFYRTGLGSGNNHIVDARPSGSGSSATFLIYMATGTTTPLYYTSGSTKITSSINLGANVWTHMAVVRNSGTTTLYMDGVSGGSFSDSTNYVDTAGSTLGFWAGSSTDYSQYTTPGFFDDFRVTKGLARYTSSFTPPTTAHLNSAGDVNKQIVINSDADGVAVGTGGINQARIAKAWVNFNGTSTVAIRSSYNVSSITDNGTGDYTANLSTALSDTNGSAVAMTGYIDHTWGIPLYKDVSGSNPLTTTQFRVGTVHPNTSSVTYEDQEQVSILIFGN